MPVVEPHSYLLLAAVLFVIGLAGVIMRRNLLVMLMCVELMLNAANLTFVAYARTMGDLSGQVFALIIMAIAAAEAAVGLAIVVGVYRSRATLEVDEVDTLREDT